MSQDLDPVLWIARRVQPRLDWLSERCSTVYGVILGIFVHSFARWLKGKNPKKLPNFMLHA